MKKNITENDLREYGFTEKEIIRLREILTRPESKDESYCDLIDDLRQRFWGGVIGILIVLVLIIIWICNFEVNDFTYPVVIIFTSIAVYKITPIPMALKSYLAYLKTR